MIDATEVPEGGWVYCERCGKKLLRRKPNGIFVFKFGKRKGGKSCVVDMEILGSIKMKCLRPDLHCGHINIINFLPDELTIK